MKQLGCKFPASCAICGWTFTFAVRKKVTGRKEGRKVVRLEQWKFGGKPA